MENSHFNSSRSTGGGRRRQSPQVSRRLFLGGLGAGAAGLVGAPGVARAALPAAPAAVTQIRADRFGRLFPDLPGLPDPTDEVRALLRQLGRPAGLMDAGDFGGNPSNPDHPVQPAGITYLGQFIDHDMTFDTTSELGFPTPPEDAPNARTPALDLDSVYGGGPVANPALYQSDRVKLRIESGGRFEDLPREPDGAAIIADPRNDEHLILAGLHAAVVRFHNRVVDLLRGQGISAGLFAAARRLVTWHYQWIVLHEFLPQVVGAGLTDEILTQGRQVYLPEPAPAFIPVEFQAAAYRFGHSQVRPEYRANRDFAARIFDPAAEGQSDPDDLRGGSRAPRRFVDWQFFFDFGDGAVQRNKRIDRKLSTPLFDLPLQAIPEGAPPTSLAQRNLLRHLTWELPSGILVSRELDTPRLDSRDLGELRGELSEFIVHTPLWYYLLAEADILAEGRTLGPAGGRIVGEVIIGVVDLDPTSYRAVQPDWVPTLPARQLGNFTMVDLLTFAQVDPASRGQ